MKKVFIFFFSCVMILATTLKPINAKNNTYAGTLGFTLDEDNYINIGLACDLIQYVYYRGALIGTSNTTIIFATQRQKIGDENVNVALYHTTMNPCKFSGESLGGKILNYEGKSDYLEVSTVLPRTSQKYVKSFPENVAGSTQYTLGANLGANADGVTGGVTATMTFTKNRLEIKNSSNISEKKYCIAYDYKTHFIGTNKTNDYLKNISTQIGSFYYRTDGNTFSFPVTIFTSFGYYSGVHHYDGVVQKYTPWTIGIA